MLLFAYMVHKKVIADATTFPNTDVICPSECTCIGPLVTCEGWIPRTLADSAEAITLLKIDPREFYPRMFCNVSWKAVRKLSISTTSRGYDLIDGVFDCLGQLEHFKMKSAYLSLIRQFTFSGLTNLTSFDLSDCFWVLWVDIHNFLSVKTNLPKLTHLYLSKVGVYRQDNILMLNQQFINVFGWRPIRKLDLSYSKMECDFSVTGKLCNTLTSFIHHGSEAKVFNVSDTCSSLQIVDFSGMNKRLYCRDVSVDLFEPFFGNVRTWYQNTWLTDDHEAISNCSVIIPPSVREFYSSKNYVPNFDVTLYGERLIYLNLSDNSIETINRNAFKHLTSLRKLDLSYNKLYKTNTFNVTFSVLFKKNLHLRVLDLSSNRLPYLPDAFSTNSDLQELRLSNNTFHQIDFNVSHLIHLLLLNLEFNSVRSVHLRARQMFDFLLKRNNNRTHILLKGNPLTCSCDSLDFLRWLIRYSNFNYCQLNSQDIHANGFAMVKAEKICEEPKRESRILWMVSILSFILVAVSVTLVILHTRLRKRKLLKKHYEDRIRIIQDNNLDFKFPVFLSYSSTDREFVYQHVLHQLQVCKPTLELLHYFPFLN